MGKELQGVVSSRFGPGEDLTGNPSQRSQRPTILAELLPSALDTATASVECSTKPLPPFPPSRSLSKQYNQICRTHKKLVKSGAIKCSVSLSNSPTTVEQSSDQTPGGPLCNGGQLPSAPSSPVPDRWRQESSVHWGVVGDFSGVQTPFSTPERPSVIVYRPPNFQPPKPSVRQPLASSPRLIENVSSILQLIPEYSSPVKSSQNSKSPSPILPIQRSEVVKH